MGPADTSVVGRGAEVCQGAGERRARSADNAHSGALGIYPCLPDRGGCTTPLTDRGSVADRPVGYTCCRIGVRSRWSSARFYSFGHFQKKGHHYHSVRDSVGAGHVRAVPLQSQSDVSGADVDLYRRRGNAAGSVATDRAAAAARVHQLRGDSGRGAPPARCFWSGLRGLRYTSAPMAVRPYRRTTPRVHRFFRLALLYGVLSMPGACRKPQPASGEELARAYCSSCHAFPDPGLLDKNSWQKGVLPQMAPRVGVKAQSLYDEMAQNPYMRVLLKPVPPEDWEKIVGYFTTHAPDSLPEQSLPAEPALDPAIFRPVPFAARLQSTGIITLLKADSIHQRFFVGEAGSNTLRVFDWNRRLLSSTTLGSPPTDL